MYNKKILGDCRIGILGGIGPEATGTFYLNIIKKIQEKFDLKSNTEFPKIFINSINAPELIHSNVSKSELQSYVDGLRELDKFNPDFIVMACNTIHLFHTELQKTTHARILDMQNEINAELKRRRIKSFLILATPMTTYGNLYAVDGAKCFRPNKNELEEIANYIKRYNSGHISKRDMKNFRKIINKYRKLGAESVILGCTELSLLAKDMEVPKIDAMDIMVEATLNKIDGIAQR